MHLNKLLCHRQHQGKGHFVYTVGGMDIRQKDVGLKQEKPGRAQHNLVLDIYRLDIKTVITSLITITHVYSYAKMQMKLNAKET
jgi:hypothetical protein